MGGWLGEQGQLAWQSPSSLERWGERRSVFWLSPAAVGGKGALFIHSEGGRQTLTRQHHLKQKGQG